MHSSLALLALGAASALAASCGLDQLCPEDSPCCSQYGECGVGAFCLGGCDPRMSFSLDSCAPAPVCEDKTYKFTSMDGIVEIDKYLGDPSTADWVYQGEPTLYQGDSMLLTMPKDSVGTVMASTVYMWYGNVKAKFKTSRGRGVVTAFILLSDVKDEIDYEFVGVDLETAQTNFYFQAVPNYNNSGNISVSDSFDNYHEYEVNWTPDTIEWLVDGEVGRTVKREDTWNASSNQWAYPQTPARVQLSIWPGGDPSNAQGTIDWAGGEIEWSGPDIDDVGYYYTTFSEVTIGCYNADSPPGTNSGKSYTYNNVAGTNDTVVDGDASTILGSFDATGLDMDAGAEKSGSSTNTAASASSTQAQVPGGSNGSPSSQDHSDGQDSGSDSDSDSGSSSGGSSGGSAAPPPDTTNCDTSSFNQDCNGNSGSSGSGSGSGSDGSKPSASILAIIIAGCALYWL